MSQPKKMNTVKELADWQKGQKSEIQSIKDAPITAAKRNMVGVGLGVVGLFFVMMFALQIITGLLALVLMAGTAVGLFFGKKYVEANNPIWQEKIKMKALESRIKNVQDNAVIFLTQIALAKHASLEQKFTAHKEMKGLLKQLESNVGKAKGEGTKKKLEERVKKLKVYIEQGEEALKKMKKNNEIFDDKVADAKLDQKTSNIFNKFTAISSSEFGNKLDEMLTIEAFEAIEDDINNSEAALESEELKRELGL